jgi:hypothetical protein
MYKCSLFTSPSSRESRHRNEPTMNTNISFACPMTLVVGQGD